MCLRAGQVAVSDESILDSRTQLPLYLSPANGCGGSCIHGWLRLSSRERCRGHSAFNDRLQTAAFLHVSPRNAELHFSP